MSGLILRWVPSRLSHGDYRDVAGIKMPFTWTASQTYMQMTVKLTDIAPNVPVDAARFMKPQPGMAKAIKSIQRGCVSIGAFWRISKSRAEQPGGTMRIRSASSAFAAGTMVALLGAVAPVQAHHSFSAVYDGNKPVTLRGMVSKMGWQNPHAHIYIDVKNPTTGQMVTWEVESAGASNLLRAGLRREDFIGAEVIVKGFLAKDGTPTVNASSFTLVEAKKEFTSDEAAPGAR